MDSVLLPKRAIEKQKDFLDFVEQVHKPGSNKNKLYPRKRNIVIELAHRDAALK